MMINEGCLIKRKGILLKYNFLNSIPYSLFNHQYLNLKDIKKYVMLQCIHKVFVVVNVLVCLLT